MSDVIVYLNGIGYAARQATNDLGALANVQQAADAGGTNSRTTGGTASDRGAAAGGDGSGSGRPGTGGGGGDRGNAPGGDSSGSTRTGGGGGGLKWGTTTVIPLGPGNLIADLKKIARRGVR